MSICKQVRTVIVGLVKNVGGALYPNCTSEFRGERRKECDGIGQIDRTGEQQKCRIFEDRPRRVPTKMLNLNVRWSVYWEMECARRVCTIEAVTTDDVVEQVGGLCCSP